MPLTSWLKAFFGNKAPANNCRRRRARSAARVCLQLETLEDRLVPTAPVVNTSTSLAVLVNGSAAAKVGYGTSATLIATIAAPSGNVAPSAGSVDFHEGSIDLGSVSTETVSGGKAVFTLKTTPRQLQAGGVQTLTATYAPGTGFSGSSGSLAGGLKVTPAPLTIAAAPNTKTWDSTTSAAAIPTVTGLISGDTITGLAEVYSDPNVGTGKTLNVSAYTVSDGNVGKNYAVTTVTNHAGVITAPVPTFTMPSSMTVIEPPLGMSYTFDVPVTVNLPLNYTVTYKTIGGNAVAGTDYVAANPGTLHINNASGNQATVQIPITIIGGAYQALGGLATKIFTVELLSAVSNGTGNLLNQSLQNAASAQTTINLQQVTAPIFSISNQGPGLQGVVLNVQTYWPTTPTFSPAQYAQASGDVFLKYGYDTGLYYQQPPPGQIFPTIFPLFPPGLGPGWYGLPVPLTFANQTTLRIPVADLLSVGQFQFQIPNFKFPSSPASGNIYLGLVATTPNASISEWYYAALITYP
jgi:hypothetical protein